MHILWGRLMPAGRFMLVCASLKSECIVYRLLCARSRIMWGEHDGGVRWECPECGCGVYDHSEERSWRHLDTCPFKTLIHARIPRVNCEKCGVRQVKVSWADAKSRFTLLMEALIVEVLEQTRSVKAACRSAV